AAEATSAAAVLMLKVPTPSPPVPQVSSRSSRPNSARTIRRRKTAAAAANSADVSPFIRQATRSAAASASPHSPSIRPLSTAVVRSGERSQRSRSAANASGNQVGGVGSTDEVLRKGAVETTVLRITDRSSKSHYRASLVYGRAIYYRS